MIEKSYGNDNLKPTINIPKLEEYIEYINTHKWIEYIILSCLFVVFLLLFPFKPLLQRYM